MEAWIDRSSGGDVVAGAVEKSKEAKRCGQGFVSGGAAWSMNSRRWKSFRDVLLVERGAPPSRPRWNTRSRATVVSTRCGGESQTALPVLRGRLTASRRTAYGVGAHRERDNRGGQIAARGDPPNPEYAMFPGIGRSLPSRPASLAGERQDQDSGRLAGACCELTAEGDDATVWVQRN